MSDTSGTTLNERLTMANEDVSRQAITTTTSYRRSVVKRIELNHFSKIYLILYNVSIFAGFAYVYSMLIYRAIGRDSIYLDRGSITSVCDIVRVLTFTQFLECAHPLMGLVPGGPFVPFAQLIGRALIMIFLYDTKIQSSSSPWIFCLFVVWSSIEVIRYPYYALRVLKLELPCLTWLRYSLFLPLYPCGGLCENMVMLYCARHYEKNHSYQYMLPNALNISFSLAFCIQAYLIFLLHPTILMLMRYMWSQRTKQFAHNTTNNKMA
ncbi:Very-long-chain (3R)-3-hydroxyacyl-CoA dehydratase [Fragariocoptes setiger]|uniref:Very-long-chain (3R)-3-hydroxyacyl-CoA dehydratase n=1 Tax=Fragariocoptes setiger TaxID=1670756 RepID=A0ABQ7S952_9ACAR|nr:Very-long-chain (3R)-3-hydroxyacyl-CoA dehydratase [Fragariocoptes setiger]